MRLIDADHLDKRIYEEIPLKEFGTIKRMARMREIIAEEPTVGNWISVKDRLPERGNTCLVWLRGGGMTFMVFDGSRFIGGSAYSDDRITHWMLLPGAPKEVETDA